MAKIPDEAIKESAQISHAAFHLYAVYCMHRNKESGRSWPSVRRIQIMTGIHFTYIQKLRQQLIDEGWVRLDEDGKVIPLKGYERSDGSNRACSDESNRRSDGSNIACSDGSNECSVDSKGCSDGSNDHIRNIEPCNEPVIEPEREACTPSALIDERFLDELQANPAYTDIDVRHVYAKMLTLFKEQRKQPTRERLISWLNREHRPMQARVEVIGNGNRETRSSRNVSNIRESLERF